MCRKAKNLLSLSHHVRSMRYFIRVFSVISIVAIAVAGLGYAVVMVQAYARQRSGPQTVTSAPLETATSLVGTVTNISPTEQVHQPMSTSTQRCIANWCIDAQLESTPITFPFVLQPQTTSSQPIYVVLQGESDAVVSYEVPPTIAITRHDANTPSIRLFPRMKPLSASARLVLRTLDGKEQESIAVRVPTQGMDVRVSMPSDGAWEELTGETAKTAFPIESTLQYLAMRLSSSLAWTEISRVELREGVLTVNVATKANAQQQEAISEAIRRTLEPFTSVRSTDIRVQAL